MLDFDLKVVTDQFDGPLSLLLHLAEKQEMDLNKLDISLVTGQYLDYLKKMRELNFDLAGDYLFMASNLIYLKSLSCLGNPLEGGGLDLGGEEGLKITSRSDLIARLQLLRHFQNLGQKLWALPKLGQEVFVHPPVDRKALINTLLLPMEVNQLAMAMVEVLKRESRRVATLPREALSVKQKILTLKNFLLLGKIIPFQELLSLQQNDDSSLSVSPLENRVVTFMAILELTRLKKLSILQHEDLQDIYVEVLESLDNFDMDQVENFESLIRAKESLLQ